MRVLAALLALMFSLSAMAGDVTLTASDGVKLHAIHTGSGPKGVVLVHADGRSGADWKFFVEKIGAHFNVLQLDLRGHGQSPLGRDLAEEDYPAMLLDVAAGITFLRGKGATEITLVGAELGANLALNAAATDEKVVNLVLLTPGLNEHGHKVSAAIDAYGTRPVLFVASSMDSRGSRAVVAIEERAKGFKQLELLDEEGAGVKLLDNAPALHATMVGWLNQTFKTGTAPGSDKSANLQSAGVGSIQTTGTLLEDRDKQKKEGQPTPPPPPPAPE